jgi:copper chaperone
MNSTRTYSVPEISSGHCRAAITAEVGRLSGVTSVEVDLEEQRVTVAGSALDDVAIRRAIYEAGYDARCAVEHPPTGGYVGVGSTREGSQ